MIAEAVAAALADVMRRDELNGRAKAAEIAELIYDLMKANGADSAGLLLVAARKIRKGEP